MVGGTARGGSEVLRSPPTGLTGSRLPTVHRRRWAWRTTLLLAATACRADAPAAAPTIVDSAGVRVVSSTAPRLRAPAPWVVEPNPRLVIGTRDGPRETVFHQVRGAARLDGGRVVVADRGSNQLRFFDGSGRLVATAGGEGEGPGEFLALDGVWRGARDTLAAPDRATNRVSFFDGHGTFVGAVDIHPGAGGSRPFKIGRMADGTLVATTVRASSADRESGVRQDSVRYLAFDPDGGRPRDIAVVPYIRLYALEAGGRPFFDRVPFSNPAVRAVGTDRLWVGREAGFELAGFAPDGRLVVVVRRSHEPRSVGPAERRAYRDRVVAQAAAEEAPLLERFLADVPWPNQQPAMASAIVDREGHLWVEGFRFPPGTPSTWSVFAPDGTWETDVELPAGLTPLEIGRDWVLGVRADDLGVERVTLHHLERAGSLR